MGGKQDLEFNTQEEIDDHEFKTLQKIKEK